jgi:uncharacterized protein
VIKVVLDTNIVVSAVLKPGSNPSSILQLCLADPGFKLITSEALLTEYDEVLRRPRFHFSRELVDRLMALIRHQADLVMPDIHLSHLVNHAADAHILECAVAGGANLLITGNQKHFIIKRHGSTRILSPAEFVELMLR